MRNGSKHKLAPCKGEPRACGTPRAGPPEIAVSSYAKQGGHMIKILLTVAVLGSLGDFAGLAMPHGEQGEASGREVSPQCAHRRARAPDPTKDCRRRQASD